jgi:hypothetical protein
MSTCAACRRSIWWDPDKRRWVLNDFSDSTYCRQSPSGLHDPRPQ